MTRHNQDRPIVDAAKVTASAVILTPVALIAIGIVLLLVGMFIVSVTSNLESLVWFVVLVPLMIRHERKKRKAATEAARAELVEWQQRQRTEQAQRDAARAENEAWQARQV
jgi:hypothetical protein